MNLESSVALVTGANRGLGKELVHALIARGARKIYVAVRDPSSIELAHLAASSAVQLEAVRLDVTNADDLAALANVAHDVSLVINNAGISRGSSLLGSNALAAAHEELATNVFGPLAITRALAPVLARRPASAVVNILSVLSWITLPGAATYSLSKAAAWSMTNGLRAELAAQGTNVIAVHVGFMDTDMAASVTQPKIAPSEVAKLVLDGVEADAREILADTVSQSVKSALSSENAPYLLLR